MSAGPPIATELMTRGSPSLGANRRHMQRSKLRLFDHLVGERDVLGLTWAGLAPADRASFA
jgi:hypothetical protein